eukprot:gene21637-27677_t
MSFTDFLRFHWMPNQQQAGHDGVVAPVGNAAPNNEVRNARNGMRRRRNNAPGVRAPLAPVLVPAAPAPVVQPNLELPPQRPGAEPNIVQRDNNIGVDPDGSLVLETDREWQLDDYHHLLAQDEPAAAIPPVEQTDTSRNERVVHIEEMEADREDFDVEVDAAEEDHVPAVDPIAPVVPPQQQQQQAPVPPAMPAAPRDENFGDIDMEDVQEAGVEIRVALFELLGVQGAWHLMFRNALWLQAFTSLYMVLVVMCPHVVGRMAINLVLSKLKVVGYVVALPGVVSRAADLLRLVTDSSTKQNVPLQFVDFVSIGFGFCTIFGAVGVLHLISVMLTQLRLTTSGFKVFHSVVQSVAIVVKVGILLFLRIFLLPVFLGSVVLFIGAQTVLPHSVESWAQLMATNAVGAYALSWSAGITFMLTMTVSVLQIREVLHPAIFARLIRPQEGHDDLIASLVQEGGLMHARRILTSTMVYLLLMVVFLYAPFKAFGAVAPLFLSESQRSGLFTYKVWYGLPLIQMPLELIVSHVVFLSLLDKNKDLIGNLQHQWLLFTCKYLGLTRYILPSPLIRKHKLTEAEGFNLDSVAHESVEETSLVLSTSASGDHVNNSSSSSAQQKEEDEVGPPMVRPMVGWDTRTASAACRWAWGTEQPSELELSVAPQLKPSLWILRCIVLLIASWTTIAASTLGALLVPLCAGRALFRAAQVPEWVVHDPLCFLVGCVMCASAATLVAEFRKMDVLKHAVSITMLPQAVVWKVTKLVAMWGLSETSVGLLITFARNPLVHSAADAALVADVDWLWGLQMWFKGALAVETVLALLFSQNVGPSLIRLLGLEDALSHWRVAVLRVVADIRQSWTLREGNTEWTLQSLPLDDIEQLLVWLLFKHLFLRGGLPLVAISLLLGVDRTSASLSAVVVVRNLKSTAVLLLVCILGTCVVRPLQSLGASIYTKIRDENYLVGRKLQNSVPGVARANSCT